MKKQAGLSIGLFLFLFTSLSAQCLDGDCWDGQGTFLYPSGAKYQGSFRDGKINGYGILFFSKGDIYEGEWVNHFREGEGKLTYKNGNIYNGSFRKSKFSGRGTMDYSNGDRYSGNWEKDVPNGKGKYQFNSGERYEGNFSDGKFSGNGTMFYTNGSRYEGDWAAGKKHGKGTLINVLGETQYGDWDNGRITQEVEVTEQIADASEEMPNCNENFCLSGQGSYTYTDGSQFIGTFVSGEPEGHGTVFYTDGNKYEGGWSNHAPHGEGKMTFASGRVFGGFWQHGKVVSELTSGDGNMEKLAIEVDVDKAVKIWAVVVGVGRYAHMPALKYTDDDAYQMYAFLKSPQGGALPDERVSVLIDEDATRDKVLASLQKTLLKADDNDVVIFYFSGHGLEGSFLPVDYNGFQNKIHHSEVKEILEKSRAKHKLVFADACHSGSLLAMKGATVHDALGKYYQAFEQSSGGLALMMSSKGEEYSLEDGGLRSGVYSHFLIKGLKGAADADGNKIVTVNELFSFVNKEVRTYTAGAQTPTLKGTFDGNMPVAVDWK